MPKIWVGHDQKTLDGEEKKRMARANQNSRLSTYNNPKLILKTTEWMIYKVLSLYYLHLFPALVAVALLG